MCVSVEGESTIFALMRRIIFFIPLFFIACNPTDESSSAVNSEDTDRINIEYAQHFTLEKKGEGYLLHILDPEKGTKEKSYTIEIGKKRKIISLSSTLNGMISILNARDQLYGISNVNYVYDAGIRKRFTSNKLKEYGDEAALSVEKIVSSKANMILYSGFGDEFPNSEQLNKLGFDIIPIYDWRETHPLGKAEWIKVVGILVGKEKEALQFFETVKQKYAETKALVSSVKSRPSVLAGYLYGDVWYTPSGDSYMAKLLSDAAADYTHADTKGTGSAEFSMETILEQDRETEYWINPGISSKKKIDEVMPHARHLKAYKKIYCYSTMLNKYWERSAAEPHLLLSDLIHIFHPEIKEISTFHFYGAIE